MPESTSHMMDNPVATGQDEESRPLPSCVEIRQATGLRNPGVLMLVPPVAPRFLLVPDAMACQLRVFDLLQPSGPGVAVLHGDEIVVWSSAISVDGNSIFLSCQNTEQALKVYDTASVLSAAAALLDAGEGETEANDQIAPRASAPNIEGQNIPGGAAFSQDAARLFVLWRHGGGITVHDASHSNLPVLRTLPFSNYDGFVSNCLLGCAGGLLVAAAGGGLRSPNPMSAEETRLRRQVQIWRVDGDHETELQTVMNPDLADAVAIRPADGLLAVGLRGGVVRLLPSEAPSGERQQHVDLAPFERGTGSTPVAMLCFSRDGTKIVAGRDRSEDFTVYDVASAVAVNRFVRPKTSGSSAVWFPAGDVLVTGGAAEPCVFHRLLPPAPRFELRTSTSADIASSSAALCSEHGLVVAMAAGSQVEVVTEAGEMLLRKDLGKDLFTSHGGFRSAVQMQPGGGKFVACSVAKRVMAILSVADGTECIRLAMQNAFGFYWSPDGALLALPGSSGVRIFSASADFAEVRHIENGENVYGCAFDKTGTRLATGTNSGCVTVWEVATWMPVRTFHVGMQVYVVCFSHSGDRVAFADQAFKVGVLSLEAESDHEPLVVFPPQINAICDLQFSPDGKFLLCFPSADQAFDQHRMRVLDLSTHTDAEWGELLRTMALPVAGGTLHGRTLGWTQLSQPHSRAVQATHIDEDAPWVLYGAVGDRFVAVDIQASLYAIQDHAWTTEQLAFCSEQQQHLVESLAKASPHSTNVRDTETGETVLHYLARNRQVESLQKWFSICPDVLPVADAHGKTTIEVALQLNQVDLAKLFWSRLSSSSTSVSALLVMQELRLMSKKFPHVVRSFLQDVEPCLVQTLATFRTDLVRAAEVCGLPTATLAGSRIDDENATGQIPSVWADKCPIDSQKTLVASKVVLLPDLLGDADSSPFHTIVVNCDAPVFESKIMQLIVQYKWEENVKSKRLWSIALYGIAFATGAIAMMTSVTYATSVSSSTADALQVLVVVIEVASLGVEVFELAHEGCATYFTGPWNVLDLLSSGLLLVGSACHFEGVVDGVRTAGALGVALKCFGMVDYLRSWPATGSLVRMISVILTDMVPFMTILLLAVLGCTLFFAINLSSSPDYDTDSLGLFRTLVTVYHMTLGIGTSFDTSTTSVLTVVVSTIFLSFVVVVLCASKTLLALCHVPQFKLNLLIAIMGDSYEKVKESERFEAFRERARIIVETEKRFPKYHRYHRFMHFVEAAAASTDEWEGEEWEGVTRRVTGTMISTTAALDKKLAKIDSKLELLDEGLAQVKSEMKSSQHKLLDALDSTLDSKLDTKLQIILDRLQ